MQFLLKIANISYWSMEAINVRWVLSLVKDSSDGLQLQMVFLFLYLRSVALTLMSTYLRFYCLRKLRSTTSLDFAKDQLSVASSRQKLKSKAIYMNIEWVVGDALDLPFSNGHFDAITMGYEL
ncbi:hypothetical protein ACLB2K_063811 [Fragaria x ananassa]